MQEAKTIVIGCGALAREMVTLIERHKLTGVTVTCLPAIWHNRPQLIPEGVRGKIQKARAEGYERIFVAYADCGTGGLLDQVLEEEGVTRIGGDHCYAFYRGTETFTEEFFEDPYCFYLTDYLARHFQRLIVEAFWLDSHPELEEQLFGHYTTLVYLAQSDDPELDKAARRAAERLGLAFKRIDTGFGELEQFMRTAAEAV